MHGKQLRGKRLGVRFALASLAQSRLFSRLVSSQIQLALLLVLFNAALSGLIQAGAPEQPSRSDRAQYDFNTDHPFSAECNNSLYCFRVLDPLVLGLFPADPEARWRTQQWLGHAATATLMGLFTAEFASPWIVSVMVQTSYGLTFAAYDPFTPDPVIFVLAALLLRFWMTDRAALVAVMGVIGIFAKETVALLVTAPALAVLLDRTIWRRWPWVVPSVAAWITLGVFHWTMGHYLGWSISKNAAASFSTGSWLAIWWKANPLSMKALMVFAPFGFGWIFAALGVKHVPESVRSLALGFILPLAALVFVQTPERALGNAFFVVVPLAAACLAQIPAPVAWIAVITNALLTTRVGLSTEALPTTTTLLIPATLAAVAALAAYFKAAPRDAVSAQAA